MSTLQVLCPNGRRQNVKITPNTKILQVLEDVCQKQKFLPPEDYKLVHGRKTLDVTLSVRYANLPNNAKLELVKSEESRAESDVLIALQLESGERLQNTFSPGITLWEVLLHWENIPDSPHKDVLTHIDSSQVPSVQPVCIYMREEVVGEESLKETQLRTLGLTGGKAVIRLIHRPVEDEVLAQISGKLEKERQRKSRLEAAAGAQQPTFSSISEPSLAVQQPISSESQLTSTVQADQRQPYRETEKTNEAVSNDESAETKSSKGEPATKKGKPESESHDNAEPMEVESGNQISDRGRPMETEETDQRINTSSANDNSVNLARQSQREAAERLRSLNIPGVEIYTPDDFHDLTPEQQQVARQLAEAYLPRFGIQPAVTNQTNNAKPKKPPPEKKQRNPQAPFADFKFPEETKGKKLYSNELSEVKQDDFQPCDRRTVLFNVEEQRESISSDSGELPDEFFDITERDLRILMSDQKKKLNALEDQPLMTSALRKSKLEEEYSQYDRVIIRIQFPDRLVLQGLFKPRETVIALQKFVKEYLEDKSFPFYLYTSPPKHVLSDVTQSLIEAKLVPATVVYFGSEEHKDHYLSSAVISELSTKMAADQVVYECLSGSSEETASQSSGQSTSSGSSKGKQLKSSARVPSSGEDKSGGKQVPKWFKTGKK